MRTASILLLTISSFLAGGQTPMEVRVFGGPWEDVGKKILEDADGGYTVFGTTGSAQNAGSQFYLLKLDSNLVYQWSRVYGGGNVDVGVSMVEHPAGSHFLFGHSNSFGSDGYHLLLYRVDEAGEVLNQWVYDKDVWEFAADIKTHPNGSLVVAYNTYGGGIGNQDMAVAMIDTLGVVQWERFLGSPGFDEVSEVEVSESGQIYVVGTQHTEDGPRGWAAALDETGVLLNEMTVGNSETHLRGALSLVDGLVFVGGYEAISGAGLDNFMVKVDFDFALLWEKWVNLEGEESNDDVIPIGNALLTAGRSNAFGIAGWGGLLHFRTGTGIFLSSVVAGGEGDEEFFDLLQDSQGRIVLVGKSDSYSDFTEADLLVMRLEDEFFGDPLVENVEVYVDSYLGISETGENRPTIFVRDGQLQLVGLDKRYEELLVHDLRGRLLYATPLPISGNLTYQVSPGIVVVTLRGRGTTVSQKVMAVR